MMAYHDYGSQAGAIASPVRASALEELNNSIQAAASTVIDYTRLARNIADRVLGSQPEPAVDKGQSANGKEMPLLRQSEQIVGILHAELERLRDQINRFDRL